MLAPTQMIIENYSRKIFIYFLYAIAFTLPLVRPNWYGILLGVFVVSWMFTQKPSEFFPEIRNHKIIFLFWGVFFVDLVGLLYTENMSYGISYLATKAPLVILPLIVLSSSSQLSTHVIRNTCVAFVAGVITLNLASLAFISYDLWDPERLEANLIIANNSIVKIHPVFLSQFIAFGFFFIVDTYFPLSKTNRNQLGWVLFSCIVLLVYLMWLNSRIGIAGFVLASIFYILYAIRKNHRFSAFAGLTIFIFLLLFIPFSRERFIVTPLQVLTHPYAVDVANYNTRTLYFREDIYSCCIALVNGPRFFYGYGTGDFKDVLQDCYAGKNYTSLLERNLDSHCEYFAQLHRNGIIGLLAFLALLLVPFYYSLRYYSPVLGVFMILFGVTALFENIMSSQKGVTFFSLFCPLLLLYARSTGQHKPLDLSKLQ